MYFSEQTLKTIFNEVADAHEAQMMALYKKETGGEPTAQDKAKYRQEVGKLADGIIRTADQFIGGVWQDAATPGTEAARKLQALRDGIHSQMATAELNASNESERDSMSLMRSMIDMTLDRALAHVNRPSP